MSQQSGEATQQSLGFTQKSMSSSSVHKITKWSKAFHTGTCSIHDRRKHWPTQQLTTGYDIYW